MKHWMSVGARVCLCVRGHARVFILIFFYSSAGVQLDFQNTQGKHAQEHTHTPTPQPGVVGRSRKRSPNTHTHGALPSQEWRGAS